MKSVDDWILVPNKNTLKQLEHVLSILRHIQPVRLPEYLYRGFSPKSSYQNTMGLSDKGFFWNTVKHHKVGDVFTYQLRDPVSFTSNIDIARAFGDTIIEVSTVGLKDHALVLTDELCYVVGKLRNHTQKYTQDEVIVLPSALEIRFKVIETH